VDVDKFSAEKPAVSRREVLHLAVGALVAPVLALSGWPARLPAAALPSPLLAPQPPAPRPEGAANIPAKAVLDPSQLADILAHPGDKPTIICVGFPFLFDGGHIPGALYRGPGQNGAGIVALSTWAGNQKHDKSVVIYCGCCPWTVCPNIEPAYAALLKMGLTNVKVLRINQNFGADWASKGYPTEKKKSA
jgi:thiosulfate/3-mercaptopyruvate sulfurtransferase